MANLAGQTVEASDATSDDTSMYLTIPSAGYYDSNSKISTVKMSDGIPFIELDSSYNSGNSCAYSNLFLDVSKYSKIIISGTANSADIVRVYGSSSTIQNKLLKTYTENFTDKEIDISIYDRIQLILSGPTNHKISKIQFE